MKTHPATYESEAIAAEFKEYAYSVSHDLSAPVRAMVEFSKLLTAEHADALSAEGREYLCVIIENGQKMQVMMEGLLQYSRLNTMAKPFTKLNSKKVVENCLVVLASSLRSTKAVVEFSDLPEVMADFDHFTDLFLILLDNAIKFQPKDNTPRIHVSSEKKHGFWQFAVRDNGIGIAPQYQEKIFKPFARLHSDEEYPGIGIGLTLAQKILSRHGGTIWYESTPGKGTVFYFTLQNGTV